MAMTKKDRKKHNPFKIWKNPIRWYAWFLDAQITAEEPTDIIEMNVEIKKGEKEGAAIIPCSIFTVAHAIDLNPSLLKKKTGKITEIPINGKVEVAYNPNEDILLLNSDEKIIKQRPLTPKDEEYEKCGNCGQKVVVAQVTQTRYRSCPKVEVELSHPVTEDVIIPMNFGINIDEIKSITKTREIFLVIASLMILMIFCAYAPIFFPNMSDGIATWQPSEAVQLLMIQLSYGIMLPGLLFFMTFFLLVPLLYASWATRKWWKSVEKTMKVYDARQIKVYNQHYPSVK